MDFLFSYKKRIDSHLEHFLQEKEKKLSGVNSWGSDVIKRLLPIVIAGKSIRGCLVLYTNSLIQTSNSEKILDAAAALELFHTGLLIHDDIMDNDSLRRGLVSIHTQYEKLKNKHFGISMGINAADLCFFLAYELLPFEVTALVSHEFSFVTIAQMQDVVGINTQEEIESVFRYKTARYSFSLPMAVGAILAKADNTVVSELQNLGEAMGMLFQIRDDELDRQNDIRIPKAQYIETAHAIIEKLPITIMQKSELVSLVAFCHNRTE